MTLEIEILYLPYRLMPYMHLLFYDFFLLLHFALTKFALYSNRKFGKHILISALLVFITHTTIITILNLVGG